MSAQLVRSWVARGGVVSIVAALMSVALVVSAGPARAASPVDEAIKITVDAAGKAKAAAPSVIRGASAGRAVGTTAACLGTGGVGCLVMGAVTVGLIGYDTRNLWMPWLEQTLTPEGGEGTEPSAGGGVACYSINWNGPPEKKTDAYGQTHTALSVNLDVREGPPRGYPYNDTGYCYVVMDIAYQCKDGRTADYGTFMAQGYANTPTSLTINRTICPKSEAINVRIRPKETNNNTGDNGITWSVQLPPDDVEMHSRLQCKNPDTGEIVTKERTALGWVPVAGCPEGTVPHHLDVTTTDPATGEKTNRGSYPLSPSPQDEIDYPLCVVAGVSICEWRIDHDGQTCKPGDPDCESWTRRVEAEPDAFECFYGPYRLPIEECGWMERAYEGTTTTEGEPVPRRITPTLPNTDGDPDTYTDPAPPNHEVETPTDPQPEPSPSTSTAPAPAPTYGDSCGTEFGLGPVQTELAATVSDLAPRFGVDKVGGYRESDPYPDHPSGLAADFMTGTDMAKGRSLADYAVANAADLGINYVMFDSQIWSSARSAEGWRDVADRGSDTANHKDHVHVTVNDVDGDTRCQVEPNGDPETTSSQCFPSGWSAFNPVQWVLKPTKCALDWAFTPSTKATTSQVNRVKQAVGRTGGAEVLRVASDRAGELGGNAAGCQGPGIRFKVATIDRELHPFAACTEPMSTVAHYAKSLTTVVLVVGGGLALVRAVTSGFGFNFTTRAGSGGVDA